LDVGGSSASLYVSSETCTVPCLSSLELLSLFALYLVWAGWLYPLRPAVQHLDKIFTSFPGGETSCRGPRTDADRRVNHPRDRGLGLQGAELAIIRATAGLNAAISRRILGI
jgi:hypothetical protein